MSHQDNALWEINLPAASDMGPVLTLECWLLGRIIPGDSLSVLDTMGVSPRRGDVGGGMGIYSRHQQPPYIPCAVSQTLHERNDKAIFFQQNINSLDARNAEPRTFWVLRDVLALVHLWIYCNRHTSQANDTFYLFYVSTIDWSPLWEDSTPHLLNSLFEFRHKAMHHVRNPKSGYSLGSIIEPLTYEVDRE